MRVALIGAEHEENLAVRYLRGALERAGHEVGQIVFNHERELEAAARAAASGFELVGLSMVFTARAREFAALAARLRELGSRALLVAGGHFAAFNAGSLLESVPALDAVVLGEGEGPLVELASGRSPGEVSGLVLRQPSGRLVRTGSPRVAADLDALAWPTRKEPCDEFLGLPIVNVLASRGCTHGCSFCSIAAWHRLCGGERHRVREAETVASEMAALHRQGVRIFNFHDDNFLPRGRDAALERVGALRRALRRRRLGRIAVALKCRPDAVDPEVLASLQRLGVFRLFLGIEAGSAEALRRLGRGQTLEENHRALELVNQADLHACYNLLLFNPDSTLEDVAENLRFLRRHPDNPMNFCRTEVYAGTPLERRLAREGRLLGDFWGRHYRIADPRAQRMFEIALGAFYARNYGTGPTALHHLAMRVDFEGKLLEHFGWSGSLRPAVKAFVRRVNASTGDLLEELVARIAAARRLPSSEGSLARELASRVAEENEQLGAEGTALCDAIRGVSRGGAGRGDQRWATRAAAAGLVATLTLGAGACREHAPGVGTHVYETVALPLEGDPGKIREPLGRAVLPAVARLLGDQRTEIEIVATLGHDGALGSCTFKTAGGEPQRCPAVPFRVSDPELLGRRFRVRYSAEEVARAPRTARPDAGETQMAEMAPAPRPSLPDAGEPGTRPPAKKALPKKRAPTHPAEMAPAPRLPGRKAPAEER